MKNEKYTKIVEPSIKLARKRINKETDIKIFKLDDKYKNEVYNFIIRNFKS